MPLTPQLPAWRYEDVTEEIDVDDNVPFQVSTDAG
jgi:hypothetical protein